MLLQEIHANLLGAAYMNHFCHLAAALTMDKSLDYTIQNQTDFKLLE